MSERMSSQLKQELIDRYNHCQHQQKYCVCGSSAKDEYRRMIFWKRYSFCSAWCQYNTESDIRKYWKRSTRNLIR